MKLKDLHEKMSGVTQGQALDLFCSGVVVIYTEGDLYEVPATLEQMLKMILDCKRAHWYRLGGE